MEIPAETFAARVPEGAKPVHGADIYLAIACACGGEQAIRHLASRYLERIPALVARSGVPHEICPDVAAIVAQKLLVGPPPRISAYSGRGPLGGWIRVLAVRVGLDLARAQKARGSLEQSVLPDASPDPELLHARAYSLDRFQAAFAAAVRDLPVRERTLLRLHHLDGWSVDQLGRLFRIHRATAARRVARARQAVLESTRERLGVGTTELRSLVGFVGGLLNLDVGELLQTP